MEMETLPEPSRVQLALTVWKDLVGPAQAAIVCAILGFTPLRWTEQITVDAFGASVCRYNDVTAFMFGALGIAMAMLALWHGRKSRNRTLNYSAGAVGLVFGVIHILRGLGYILGPCN